MLEATTIQKVNELIQIMVAHHIQSYNSNQPVNADDIHALANLVESLNLPPEPPLEKSPVVGFLLPTNSDGDDDEE